MEVLCHRAITIEGDGFEIGCEAVGLCATLRPLCLALALYQQPLIILNQMSITRPCIARFCWQLVGWSAMASRLKPRTAGGTGSLKWRCSCKCHTLFSIYWLADNILNELSAQNVSNLRRQRQSNARIWRTEERRERLRTQHVESWARWIVCMLRQGQQRHN